MTTTRMPETSSKKSPGLLTVEVSVPLKYPNSFRTEKVSPSGTPWWKPWFRAFHAVDRCLPESQLGVGNWFVVRLVWK